ncbi:MAG: HIT domain-containing protein [bacterium]|nr:HIT domain-containing protein [bacterium]
MKDCLFCKIINETLPSSTVYEDDLIKIIMNINPNTNGHLLIIPKKHYVNIMDIDEEIITHSLKITREKIYPLLKEKLNCEGLTIAENNELGQEIRHFHIHLIPRYQNDGADISYKKENLDDIGEIFEKLVI